MGLIYFLIDPISRVASGNHKKVKFLVGIESAMLFGGKNSSDTISTVAFEGIFTPSDELAKEVVEASEVSGEKLWRMPLEDSYWESIKSGVADMVNTGGRQGGAITAAPFLKQVCMMCLIDDWTFDSLEFTINSHCNIVSKPTIILSYKNLFVTSTNP